MKRKNLTGLIVGVLITGGIIIAADHIDAPAVTGTGSTSLGTDITDLYAFQSPADNSKMVFVIGTQGLLSPTATMTASFPANTLYEINIDNTGDNVEDLVIQCIVQNGKIRAYGPAAVGTPGLTSTIKAGAAMTEAMVTTAGSNAVIGSGSNGINVFAGPRDDPFFFDLARYAEIIAGTATGFRMPGMDTFAGTNVMAIVVEIPKSLLGASADIKVWVESKTK